MADVEGLIHHEAEQAEARRRDPLPSSAVGTRPNSRGGAAPRILSVRLSGEQFDRLTVEAEHAGVPVSTLARMLVLRGLAPSGDEGVGPEEAERLSTVLRDAIRSEVQHAVHAEIRAGVREELHRTVKAEFLREPA